MSPPAREAEAEKLRKIYQDIYEGRGPANPSLTTRMQSAEDRVTNLEEYIEKKESRIDAKMNILITTTVGAIIAWILQHFKIF